MPLLLTLTAWLLATGGHWDLVQTFAWGRMFASYVRTVPVHEAVRLTFTPGNECSVCDVVQRAKQQDPEPAMPGPAAVAKFVLGVPPTSEVLVAAPELDPWPRIRAWPSQLRRDTPPVPPPRLASI